MLPSAGPEGAGDPQTEPQPCWPPQGLAQAAEAGQADVVVPGRMLEVLLGLLEGGGGSSWEVPVSVVTCQTSGAFRSHQGTLAWKHPLAQSVPGLK